jgi:hypothetical protein
MNMYKSQILFDAAPAPGGGGAPAPQPPPGGTPPLNDFVKSLPADLQVEKSLHNVDSVATLAKGFVHAQKLIGAKRVAVPEASWNESQQNEFYDAIGRPKTAGDYVPPKIEGFPEIKSDDPRWKQTAEALHKAGLTQRQAETVLTRYAQDQLAGTKAAQDAIKNTRAAAEETLKAEWGDKYAVNVDLAKAVVTKFGDPDLMSYINEGGGNDPRLIKSLAKMGAAMVEDKSRGGSAADSLQITDQTRATQEIGRLKTDEDFMKSFLKKDHPGHKAAVQQMLNLQKIATGPGTVAAA